MLSGQQPYVETKHAAGFLGRGLHFGFCSTLTAASNALIVVETSSYSVASVVDQMSIVDESTSEPVELSTSSVVSPDAVDSSVCVLSVAPVVSVTLSSVDFVSSVPSLFSVVSPPSSEVSFSLVSSVTLASVVSVLSSLEVFEASDISSELFVASPETSVLISVL